MLAASTREGELKQEGRWEAWVFQGEVGKYRRRAGWGVSNGGFQADMLPHRGKITGGCRSIQ